MHSRVIILLPISILTFFSSSFCQLMALQFLLKLDAPEQSTKVDNSGSTTVGGRGFVVGVMLSRHYIAGVGCSLYVEIDLAPVNFCSEIFSCSLRPKKDHHCRTTR
jgi:hypothetical protein